MKINKETSFYQNENNKKFKITTIEKEEIKIIFDEQTIRKLKFNILGYNQIVVSCFQRKVKIQNKVKIENLDLIDLYLLDWFENFYNTEKMVIIFNPNDNLEYKWLNYKKIEESLPFLDISIQTIAYRFKKMSEMGVLKHFHCLHQGSYSCYRFNTEIYSLLKYEENKTVELLNENINTLLKNIDPLYFNIDPLYNKTLNKIFSSKNNSLLLSKDNNKSSLELLKQSFKKQNKSSKIKNKLSYEDAKQITKNCLDLFYNKYIILHPKTKKNCFYAEDKIYECEKLINYFIYGFPITNYIDLRQFVINDKLLNNNFNVDEGFRKQEGFFKKYFEIALNIYDINYNPIDKENLPTHLKDFLYCTFKQFKSYFLYYAFNPVKEIQIEKIRKDKYPNVTEKYKQLLFKNKELKIEDQNKLISYVKNIVLEYERIVEKIKQNDLFKVYIGTINKFVNIHIEYLWLILEYKELNFNYLYVGGKYWQDFCDYIKKTYNIILYKK